MKLPPSYIGQLRRWTAYHAPLKRSDVDGVMNHAIAEHV
jgi:hypothetical protein